MKHAVVTFGCRVNQADSLVIEHRLRARGSTAAAPEDADVVFVNTCSVTAAADQGARQVIRRIARHNPSVRIVATGCYATRRANELRQLPNVVSVFPNGNKDLVVPMTMDGDSVSTASRSPDGEGGCGVGLTPGTAGRTAFMLGVQTGCEEECSYCIIPKTRGRSRSRRLGDVERDIERALFAGYREVVITGVHLGSYGRDLEDGSTLTHLVRRLAVWDADVLFRLSSIEPMDCTEELVDLVAGSSRLAPHFHLPLQHGCDEMLAAMRRPYSVDAYRTLVGYIGRVVPHAAMGSDIIVGFPGETEQHHVEMCALLSELPLAYLHVFPYSDRPGTLAAAMRPKVEGAAIRRRGQAVRRIGSALTSSFRRRQVGTVRRALTMDDGWSAVTDNYIKVKLVEQGDRNTWVQLTL